MLRYWRYNAGLEQRGLAAVSGVSRATIGRLERGGLSTTALVEQLTRAIGRELATSGYEPDVVCGLDLTRPLNDRQRDWLASPEAGAHQLNR
jgi:transcriptional regulator with XRE-family HTH domain